MIQVAILNDFYEIHRVEWIHPTMNPIVLRKDQLNKTTDMVPPKPGFGFKSASTAFYEEKLKNSI